MSVTPQPADPRLEALRELVGTDGRSDALLTEDLAAADVLVDRYIDDGLIDPENPPPDTMTARARLQVAADLFNRRNAQNGVVLQTFDNADGGIGVAPVRLGRDTIASARDLLRPWVLENGWA